ncbi:MAG: hypothetical protein CMM46_18155 [Rhodospirillaceae bacterium]|nr:hypothetical protein [Rhodospirillaceae bacterium]
MTRQASKLVINILGTFVGVATVLLAGLAWRLAQGPIILGSVTPFIEAAINDQNLGVHVEVSEAELTWGDWQEALEIRVLDVQVFDLSGNQIIAAHEIVLDVSLPPLVRGELRPKSVTLVRPRLSAIRDHDGSMSFALVESLGENSSEDQGASHPVFTEESVFGARDIFETFLSASATPPFDRLVEVRILGADLWVDDRMLGLTWNAPAATIGIVRHDDGVAFDSQMILRSEQHKLDTDLNAFYRFETEEVSVSSRVADFALESLSDLVPQLPGLDGLGISADGQLELLFDRDLALRYGSFLVDAEAGRIDLPALFEAPFDIGPSLAQGFIRPGFSGLEISDLELDLGPEEAHARVVIDGFDLESTVSARIDVASLPIDDVSTYWPVGLVKPARDWLVGHIYDGTVDQASIAFGATVEELSRKTIPLANLVIDLDVSDVSVEYLAGMPVVRGADGHVAIVNDTLRIDLTAGHVGSITSNRAVVSMDRLNGSEGMLVGIEMSGPVTEVLAVADHEPFALSSRAGLDLSLVSGSFSGRLELVVPKLAGLTPSDIRYRVAAEAVDVALTTELRGFSLSGGNGFMVLDSQTALLEGNVMLNGVPFEATYRQNLDPEAAVLRVAQLVGTVDDDQRAALGLADPITIDGPVGVVLDMSQAADLTMNWSAVADLTPAAIDFPIIGIDKTAGEPGRAAIQVYDDGGAVIFVEVLELGVGETVVEGSGVVRSGDLSLARLDLSRFAFARNDFAAALTVREDGFFDVQLAGGTVDVEPLMDDITASSGPELPPFRLQGRVDQIWITDDDAVRNVHIDGTYTGTIWEDLAMTGVIEDDTPMSVNIWRFSEGERRFEYNAGDAGDAIRAFGLFDTAEGGAIQIRARIDDSQEDRPARGAIRLQEFVLHDPPILGHIVSIASLTAISNALTGSGLEFEGALLPFEKHGDIVTVEDARVFGPGLGITIAGDVDLGTNMLDLNGTIVPAYVVNSVLGEIPLIGDILTGTEEGGGIFAFTFEVNGPREEPEIEVDPLSVLAPGILRNMFTAPTDEEFEQVIQGSSKPDGGR